MSARDRNPPLSSERLALEPLMPHHAAATFPHWGDERLYRFIDVVPPSSAEDLERRYGLLTSRRSPDGAEEWLNWFARTAAGEIVTLVQVTIRPDGSAYLAYMTFVEFWSRGYTSEACRAVIEFLDGEGISEWVTEVHRDNAASLRIMEKLGFRQTGIAGDEVHFARPGRPASVPGGCAR